MIQNTRIRIGSFVLIASVALLIAMFGFWFTYWKPVFSGETFPLLLHLHAALWFGWYVLLVVQSGLIHTGNRPIHKRVGIAGVAYTVILILISLIVSLQTIGRDVHLITRTIESVPTIIPLTQILMFIVLFGLATINRKQSELHKRLIVLAALVAVTPALARISIGVLGGPNVPLIFTTSNLLILIVGYADWRSARRVHPVYLWGGVAILIVRVLRIPLAMSPAWESVAAAIAVLTTT